VKKYVNASQEKQQAATARLAQELHAPKLNTPLGRPNVDYICAADPDRTLGSVFSQYAEGGQASSAAATANATTTTSAQDEDAQALAILEGPTQWTPLDESSGYQVEGRAEIEMTVAEAVMNELRDRDEAAQVLPDGVSMDVFERLLSKALITIHDEFECNALLFCAQSKVVKPDDTVDNVDWVVTFLPEGQSKEAYLQAHRRE
jgi:hypothetical protein